MPSQSRGPRSCSRTFLLTLGLVGPACDPGKSAAAGSASDTTGTTGGTSTSGAVNPITTGAGTGAIAVDCSFSFAGNQIDVTYDATGEPVETPVGGKLIATGVLSDDQFEGRSFSITIYAEDASVLSHALYQMDPAHLPVNEFAGDHGFTGLHWVKDPDADENVQFACFARDPADPPHFWL